MKKEELTTICPESQQDWRTWLKENHEKEQSVWVIYYRKNSEKYSMSWSDAVDEALCFGWIDSTRRSIDDEKFMQLFTKRKPKSGWSKINKEKIVRLIADGKMTKAGLASIETAKQNGSWSLLDTVEEMTVPKDLLKAFQQHKGSEDFFMGLSKSVKKMMLHWIVTAKRPETREKRINEIAELAAEGKKPKQF